MATVFCYFPVNHARLHSFDFANSYLFTFHIQCLVTININKGCKTFEPTQRNRWILYSKPYLSLSNFSSIGKFNLKTYKLKRAYTRRQKWVRLSRSSYDLISYVKNFVISLNVKAFSSDSYLHESLFLRFGVLEINIWEDPWGGFLNSLNNSLSP